MPYVDVRVETRMDPFEMARRPQGSKSNVVTEAEDTSFKCVCAGGHRLLHEKEQVQTLQKSIEFSACVNL